MLTVYQPQVKSWEGNQLNFRAAVAAKAQGANAERFGVVWGSARTEVDRRATPGLTFEDLSLARVISRPCRTAAARTWARCSSLSRRGRSIALDRLEAALAASQGAVARSRQCRMTRRDSRQLRAGDPRADPRPIRAQVGGRTRFDRVVNTRALILRAAGSNPFYIHVYDGWLASRWRGPGARDRPLRQPFDMDHQLAESGQVDLLDGDTASPKPVLANGVPAIYMSQVPAELIVFKGQPDFVPLAGTACCGPRTRPATCSINTANNNYYVLLSGRWLRPRPFPARELRGEHPSSGRLRQHPAERAGCRRARRRGRHAAGAGSGDRELDSADGDGAAEEWADVHAVFDGPPQFVPIAGTSLQYVVNSPTPIIGVDATTYYAVGAGVWFTPRRRPGPGALRPRSPGDLHHPCRSPLYYVTYVRIYGATPEVVYVGYTPAIWGPWSRRTGGRLRHRLCLPAVDRHWWYAPPYTYGVRRSRSTTPRRLGIRLRLGLATAAWVDSWGAVPYYTPATGAIPAAARPVPTSMAIGAMPPIRAHARGMRPRGGGRHDRERPYTNERTGTDGLVQGRAQLQRLDRARPAAMTVRSTRPAASGNVARGESYNIYTGQRSTAPIVSHRAGRQHLRAHCGGDRRS